MRCSEAGIGRSGDFEVSQHLLRGQIDTGDDGFALIRDDDNRMVGRVFETHRLHDQGSIP